MECDQSEIKGSPGPRERVRGDRHRPDLLSRLPVPNTLYTPKHNMILYSFLHVEHHSYMNSDRLNMPLGHALY